MYIDGIRTGNHWWKRVQRWEISKWRYQILNSIAISLHMMLNHWFVVFLMGWCPSSYTYSVTCFIPCRGSRLPCVLFSWVEPTTSSRMIKHGSVLTLDCSKLRCQTKFREPFSCHSAVCFYTRLLIFPSHCTLCNAEGDKNSPYRPAGFTACQSLFEQGLRVPLSCHSLFCFCTRLLIFPSHCTLCNAEGDKNSPYRPAGFTAC